MTGLGYHADRRDLRDSGTGIEPPEPGARPRGPLLAVGRQPGRARPGRRRDPRRARRRHDGRGRPRSGPAPAAWSAAGVRRTATRGDMAGLRDLMDRLARRARGAAGPLQARRRPGRCPARAGRDRGRGTAGVEQRLDRAAASMRRLRLTPPTHADAERRRAGRPGAAGDAPRRRRQAPRPARPAAARRRRPDPRPRGLRLHGAGRARSASRSCVEQLRKQVLDRVRRRHVGRDQEHRPRRTWRPTGRWSATSTSCSRNGWRAASRTSREFLAQARPRSSRARRRSTTSSSSSPQRMAAMQSLLQSMSAEQRAELQDDDGRAAARRPAALGPGPARRDARPAAARGLGRALRLPAATSRSGSRARSRRWPTSAAWTRSRTQLDGDRAARRSGGRRPRRVARAARRRGGRATSTRSTTWRKQLEQAGYADRDGDRLELTPRGSRRIGQRVLDDLFARLRRDVFGGHRVERGGRGGERDETTQAVRVRRPVPPRPAADAGQRARPARRTPRAGARGRRVSLTPADFEVFRTEQTDARPSTVLLVDMSRSMLLRGCFLAAKKVAVALDTLIRTQFPRDDLHDRRLRLLRPRDPRRRRSPSCPGTATSTARTSSTA